MVKCMEMGAGSMKKFLVFFVFLFGLACSAMARDGFEFQNDDEKCGTIIENDGSTEYVIYFETDIIIPEDICSNNIQRMKTELAGRVDDIGSIEILGSADLQGGTTTHNVDLSKHRAEWARDNFIPSGWQQYCRGFSDSQQTLECQMYALGESNDHAYSVNNGRRDSNQAARAVYVNVIWRQQTCEAETIENVSNVKQALNAADMEVATRLGVKEDIEKALTIIGKLESICKKGNEGERLAPDIAEYYTQLLSQLPTILTGLLKLNVLPPTVEPRIQYIERKVEVKVDVDMYNIVEIDAIYARLLKLRESFGVSVWRNAEGKFNTARLASDSIAGVVLGTVGGIVTSKLVKKNQLKKGFEDLSCHVGGQHVADYGDSFRMGLQN